MANDEKEKETGYEHREAKNCNNGQCACTNRNIIGTNIFTDIT